tara:strand:+ start:868 stop:2019 length:1152 start_codon:yes stop_codon:yes gene_type:complete
MIAEIPTFSKTKINSTNGQHYYRVKIYFVKANKIEYKNFSTLKLWNRPSTLSQKKTNELTRQKVEASIEAIKNTIINGNWHKKKTGDENRFFDFLDNVVMKTRGSTPENASIYKTTRKALKLFFKEYNLGDNPTLNTINTKEVAENFKTFLATPNEGFRGGKYAKSTQNTYWIRFAVIMNDASIRKLIHSPETRYVEAPKIDDPDITYLTDKELEKIESSECRIPMLKNAFLFSVYTGLRKGDIEALRWSNLIQEENGDITLDILTSKKKRKLTFRIPKKAHKWLPERRSDQHRVFLGFRYNGNTNRELSYWCFTSGISKDKSDLITSHVGRHTFAVKFLKAEGNTLYALSKALAHKSMKVTEYYYATYDKSSLDADLSRAFD